MTGKHGYKFNSFHLKKIQLNLSIKRIQKYKILIGLLILHEFQSNYLYESIFSSFCDIYGYLIYLFKILNLVKVVYPNKFILKKTKKWIKTF